MGPQKANSYQFLSIKFLSITREALSKWGRKKQIPININCKPFPWRFRNDYVKHPVTEWRQAKIGMDQNMDIFWGIEDAASHLDENVRQLQAVEFGEAE